MSFINWNSKKIINENTNNYVDGIDYDYIEEARGKKIADPMRAKLKGMEDIRGLKGTMTPRYFATKVMRYLQRNHPDTDLEQLSDEDLQKAINIVSMTSKPLMGQERKVTTRPVGSAVKDLKKGDTGFETLFLNLDDDATLSHDGDVGGNELYSIENNGLKYRVTVNKFQGTKLNLNDLDKDNVVSVVIVKPREYEAVDKLAGEIDLGQREKLVADFPEGEEDYNFLPDEAPEDDQMGVMEPEDEDAEFDAKKSDLDKDGEISEYERTRGEAIAKAMSKSEEKDDKDEDEQFGNLIRGIEARKTAEEDAERCPVTGKLRKKKSSDEEEDNEEIAMSPQQINQMMIQRGREEMHRFQRIERMGRYGY